MEDTGRGEMGWVTLLGFGLWALELMLLVRNGWGYDVGVL